MKSDYPPGSFNAHWFQVFNAISFQIMMGAPIILYTKSLGASSTVLGIVAAMTPLMTVFQLPAAKYLPRYGYRRFVVVGWSLRTVVIFMVCTVPMMAFLDDVAKMVVLLVLLLVFNLLRGISTTGWMPWMTGLIEERQRGRFLSIDQIFIHVGCLLSLVFAAVLMTGHVDQWEYALVLLVAAVAGAASVYFLRKVPDVPPGETIRRSSQSVPWRAIIGYVPFRKLLTFNVIYMTMVGSLGVFTVEYLRENSHFEVSTVLYLSAFAFVGALGVLPFVGWLIDSIGSKPLIRVATGIFSLIILLWFLIASGILSCRPGLIATMNLLAGAASATFNVANGRIVMATMPEMGRNHFFALFTVIASLGLGASPVLWGVGLDTIGSFEVVTGVFHWKRHSFYFLALLVVNVIAFAYVGRLHEPSGSGPMAASLIYGRLRRMSRLWLR
jgi:MFS family permease